jgi:hypothetical protein
MAVAPLAAADDAFAIDSWVAPGMGGDDFNTHYFDILANDLTLATASQLSSLEVISGPSHGEAALGEQGRINWSGILVFNPAIPMADTVDDQDPAIPMADTVDDQDSPLGDGNASALSGIVDQFGQIRLRVSQFLDIGFDGVTELWGDPEHVGDYSLFIKLGTATFDAFEVADFDYRYDNTLVVGKADLYVVSDAVPGTPFIAWIDNTVGQGRPDTLMLNAGPYVLAYRPQPGFAGQDVIQYALHDSLGNVTEASVFVTVRNRLPFAEGFDEQTAPESPITVAGAYDADGWLDLDSVTISQPPEHGQLEITVEVGNEFNNTISILYSPDPGFIGLDQFTFLVTDAHGGASEPATATIRVEEPISVNMPPAAQEDLSAGGLNQSQVIDVLSNDYDSDDGIDPSSLAVVEPPSHGRVEISLSNLGPVFAYTPDADYRGSDTFTYQVRDFQGAASVPAVVTINPPPLPNDDFAEAIEGETTIVDLLANDAPSLAGVPLDDSSLVFGSQPLYGRVELQPTEGGVVAIYTPTSGTPGELVVDELSDRDDGNYSAGHLSLREAVNLANADRFTDSFNYTVRDENGIASLPATITIHVSPAPTTIRFAPKLTSRRPASVRLSQIGDTSDGNSAILISSNIQILGPERGNRVTLTGLGRSSDLRLFQVASGGQLALTNLNLKGAATDGSGAVIQVAAGATASLVNCVLSDNYAYRQGGAIASLGQISMVDCRLTANTAAQGGGVSSLGTITIANSEFTLNRADYGGGLYVGLGQATLQNVTLRNNSAASGGGIYNSATLVFAIGRLTSNRANVGGGLSNIGSGLATVSNSVISANVADSGGGIENGAGIADLTPYGERGGVMTLVRTAVTDNRAQQGGGIRNFGSLAATECMFSGNFGQFGGALYNAEVSTQQPSQNSSPGQAELIRSSLVRNTGVLGGGVYIAGGHTAITNTTLGYNTANFGGGVYVAGGFTTLVSATVSENAALEGAGVYLAGTATLNSSIVAGNRSGRRASDLTGVLFRADFSMCNLIGTGGGGGLQSGVNGNVVGVAPLLGRLGNYGGHVETFPLLPGSPAIDRGADTAEDARSIAVVGQRDIGAFESQGFTLFVQGAANQSSRTGRQFTRPLQVLVTPIAAGEPVTGGVVAFTAPSAGATAGLRPSAAVIAANGIARTTATANTIPGTYQVGTMASGAAAPVLFSLTNVGRNATSLVSSARVGVPAAQPAPSSTPSGAINSTVLPSANATVVSSGAALDWSAGYAVLPRNTSEYQLTGRKELLSKPPGGRWELLAKDVQSFQRSRNGDVYLLTLQGELRRFQLGYSWATLQSGVTDFQIDEFGTIWVRDRLGFVTAHAPLNQYYILPELPIGETHVNYDPPSDFEVVHALGIDSEFGGGQGRWELPDGHLNNDVQYFPRGPASPLAGELDGDPDQVPGQTGEPKRDFDTSYYNNVRIVKEKISDKVDPPRFYDGVGWAKLHRVAHKVTVYSSTIPRNAGHSNQQECFIDPDRPCSTEAATANYGVFGQQVDRVYISHDHLHVLSYGTPPNISQAGAVVAGIAGNASSMQSKAITAPVEPSVVSRPVAETQGLGNASRLITAPDGTIYRPGRGQNSDVWYGNEAPPYFLWQLPPNGLWKPLGYFVAHAVGPDSRLYVLDSDQRLRTPALGPTKWATLATGVRSFVVDQSGTLYVLADNGELRIRHAGANEWSATETGVQSLMVTPGGIIYITTNHGDLRERICASLGSWRTVERNVETVEMVDDGTLYLKTGQEQLIRLSPGGSRTILAAGVHGMQVSPDGVVYALTTEGVLQRLTSRDHWTVLERGVVQFQVVANGDVYAVNQQHELRRQKAGYLWTTLQNGVESFTAFLDGSVYAWDDQGKAIIYSSLGRTVALAPDGEHYNVNDSDVVFWMLTAHLRRYFLPIPHPENNNERIEDQIWGEWSDQVPSIQAFLNTNRPALRYRAIELSSPPWTKIEGYPSILTEQLKDQLEPARFVAGLGTIQHHSVQFKSTIYWTDSDGATQTTIVHLDRDHENYV